ncbi:MAG: FMN-binding protein [Propionibacteriaceae bacterium]
MRRIVIWFASTVTVVVLLFAYHTSTNSPAPTAAASAGTATGPLNSPTGSASSTPSATPTTSANPSTRTPPSDPTAYTGSVAQTRWGPVQVKITVSAGKITAVDVPQYPDGNPRDQQINDYAIPILVQDTIDAQSTKIDMISGATVTSDGYVQSLQSALDEAGI